MIGFDGGEKDDKNLLSWGNGAVFAEPIPCTLKENKFDFQIQKINL